MRRHIVYLQYTNPAAYPSLEHSSRILANAGWQVLFLGTGAIGADTLRFPPHPNITVHRLAFCPPGWRQKLHYAWFTLRVLAWTVRQRPAWIYASGALSCPVALLLSYLRSLQVIYHEHDSPNTINQATIHSSQLTIRSSQSNFMRFVLWTRKRLAQRAQLCVLPNAQRAERFAAETGCGQRTVCAWNCPRREEVVQPRAPKTSSRLAIYYHGNISPDLLPASVLKAVALQDGQAELRIVGYETIGHRGYLTQLKREAESLRIEDCVQFVSALPRYELLQLARQSDVGLALMPMNNSNVNFRHMIGASNKPFDYMACGLALVVSDLPDWQAMYVEPKYSLACDPDDPASIAAALRWFLEHPEEMREMGERGRQRIFEQWNYEQQFLPVLERLAGKAQCTRDRVWGE